ncbi:hypothetical protein P8936_05585 [Edaphobacter paludis]|uniref:Flagellar hook-length control protein FliK n=1 Tax=Edaphobacter paludis TaxID=3035702 RepID=A0AAU7DBF0_9BACT
MLTATTVLTSLGTDLVNVRAPAERANSADISFARSFDESSALAVGVPSQTADQKLKDIVESESSVPVNSAGNSRRATAAVADLKMKQDANAGDETQKESTAAKSGYSFPSQKGTAPTTVGVIIPSMGVTVQHGQRSDKDSSPPISMEMSEVPIPSEDVKDLDHKNVSSVIDDTKTDATKIIAELQTDGTDSQVADIPGKQVTPVTQNLKETPTLNKDQGKVLTKREANDHGRSVKTEKSAKAEKGKAVLVVENATAVEAQPVATTSPVSIPIMVPSVDGPQHGSKAVAEDGAVSSTSSSAPTCGVGTTAVKPDGHDTKTEDIKKTDDGTVKTQGPVLTDNSVSRKTGVDEPKTALAPIKATDGENADTKSTAQPLAVSVAAHGELRVAGVPGGGAAHVIATGSAQTTEASTHTATGQSGSGVIDSAASTDATHKTLMATPTSLEIGVVNGTHGWLKIRADMTDGGVVNASLSTATSSGQEMLHRELPSLTAYLQTERVAVNAVVIQPPMASGTDFRGFDGGRNGNGQGSAQQSGNQGGDSRQGAASSAPNRVEKEGFYSGVSGVGGDELLSLASLAGGGNWLNVRA